MRSVGVSTLAQTCLKSAEAQGKRGQDEQIEGGGCDHPTKNDKPMDPSISCPAAPLPMANLFHGPSFN
jgi:hypothetical protein